MTSRLCWIFFGEASLKVTNLPEASAASAPHQESGAGFLPKVKSFVTPPGNMPYLTGVATDITERKKTEEALLQSNKKLNMVSGITRHDINNQLTMLRGYLAILENQQPEPSIKDYFQKAKNAAQNISAMIQLAKEYEEIGIHAPVWQDCRKLVDDAAKQVIPGKITVKNDLPGNAEVFADPLIVKVVYNLMDNAIRHGGEISTIRFSWKTGTMNISSSVRITESASILMKKK